MTYRFLDTPCPVLVAERNAITFWCRCGHCLRLTASDFARWPGSSLHGVARKLRCSGCGALGAIAGVICNPEHTGPAWAHKP